MMVTWFKFKVQFITCALVVYNSMASVATEINGCKGRTMDEKITYNESTSPIYFSEGVQAVINWTYCKANVSSIIGFIVIRDLYARKYVPVISMNLNGKVSYIENQEYILLNRIDKKGNDHLISFTIKNASTIDSGYYRLQIRRHGHIDLNNRVQIIVKSPDLETVDHMGRPMTEQATNTTQTSENKTISYHSKQQHLYIPALLGGLLACGALVFGMVMGIWTCHLLKRKKARNESLLDNGSEKR